MFIPTEPIGSIPRPPELLACIRAFHEGVAECASATLGAAICMRQGIRF